MTQNAVAPTDEIISYRGGVKLSSDEFKAHLATLIRLETVGVLVGAGASLSSGLGGKTVDQAWTGFVVDNATEAAWLLENKFITEQQKAGIENLNFENLIDTINITKREWERVSNSKLTKLNNALSKLYKGIIEAAQLKKELWEYGVERDAQVNALLSSHLSVIQKISSARQPGQPSPWIFTTNYDLAVEWAAEEIGLHINNGFTGFHSRTFSPHNFDLGTVNMLAKGEAKHGSYGISIAKLHGSLTWVNENGTVREETARETKKRIDSFISNPTADAPSFLIYPEAAKFFRTASFVFGELFRRFSEFLSKPQSCLIISGYSFSDEHLNRVIRAAMNNPTLQLVIYYPDMKEEEGKILIEKCDFLKRIVDLKSPQITFVGGADKAYFNKLAEHLPTPSLFDEQSIRIRKTMKQLAEMNNPSPIKDEGDDDVSF